MTLPQNLFEKYQERFETLISEAEKLEQETRSKGGPEYQSESFRKLITLKTSSISLFHQVVPSNHPHRDFIEELKTPEEPMKVPSIYGNVLQRLISYLKAIKSEFENGFLDELTLQIEAEISADYLGQAGQLLSESSPGSYDHVPAAVLAGAVLEKNLRTLCIQQDPPISTINASGKPKTLNPLIDDLKRSGVFNETKATQLRAWANIRNKAAHGEFDQFNRSDVEMMISGVENFLADYLS